MDNNNSSSNTNTLLIVLVILILVGFGAWFIIQQKEVETTNDGGLNVEVQFPQDQEQQ